jgi:hypothetical protein
MSAAEESRVYATTFLNAWADGGVYDLKVNRRFARQMAILGASLCDVNEVLRTGSVVFCDMDGAFGLWTVDGHTADNVRLVIDLRVDSKIPEIEPIKIKRK